MKAICIAVCALFLPALAPVLAVGEKDAEAPVLTWRDAETRRILFTSDDVISFDWDQQVFLLTRDATLDFLAWMPGRQARRLLVEDAQGPIYEAHWVSLLSSMSFLGPIYRPLSPNPFFSITSAYPQGKSPIKTDKDLRFAPRLRAGLKRAKKLHSINLERKHIGLAIQKTGHMWRDIGEDMKVRVEYFENTFRLGEEARAHVFFAGGEETRKQIDSMVFEIKFVSNGGTFRSDIRIEGVPICEAEKGIYVCKFAPWKPVAGSDETAKLGTGMISLTVLLQKHDKTVYRLDFPESCVPVGGIMGTTTD
jgi:hypothetical protein